MFDCENYKSLDDDGLITPIVQSYVETKHRLVTYYASLFVRGMRAKWSSLVYLDLYAGPGRAKIKRSHRIIFTSPLRILSLNDHFDRYIFCDVDEDNHEALKSRARSTNCQRDVRILHCDVNDSAAAIINEMPSYDSKNRVLGFCFLDPFKMANMKFTTIQLLAQRFMDFLVLIPSGMDANRAEHYYATKKTNLTVDHFLGDRYWRLKWEKEKIVGTSFEHFIVEEFNISMKKTGYMTPDIKEMVPVHNEKRVILYRLALYSRDSRGMDFWRKSVMGINPQGELFQ